MLFASKLDFVSQSLVNFNQEIIELEQRLELLREQKKQLENLSQQLHSAEAAAESAVQQVNTALLMIGSIDSEEVATFKSAIDTVFANHFDTPVLEASVTSSDTDTDEPLADNEPNSADEFFTSHIENGMSGHSLVSGYTIAQLKKIAADLGLKVHGKLKVNYALAISEEGITLEAIEEILAEPAEAPRSTRFG